MKRHFYMGFLGLGIVALFFAVGEIADAQDPAAVPPSGGGELDRLESGIRASNPGAPGPVAAVAPGQHVYLGARADDDAGHGVRVLSIHAGGPADQAGLMAQDLIVAAAGRKIHRLSELSTILNHLNPGDRLTLELLRGNQPLHVEAILSTPPAAAVMGGAIPPSPGQAARAESLPPPPSGIPPLSSGPVIPPPPSSPALLPPSEGPTFTVPNQPGALNRPGTSNNQQAQIEELRRKVDQLDRRVQSLERALADPARK
jgi:hypothetical protein